MKKIFPILFIIFASLGFSEENFEYQMGKDTSGWKYVQTSEDLQRVEFFRSVFQKHAANLLKIPHSAEKIPKIIHFIWLGPEEFPHESKQRLVKWKMKHPDWTFKFWTDLDRKLPMTKMECCLIDQFSFQTLGNEYYLAENFGEKAKILAYEILLQEGGLYIDHDVSPFKSFDNLNRQLDFYCGLEELAPSILSTSVIPSTHLIAAKPHHPIIEQAAQWLHENWNLLEKFYPGKSSIDCTNRIKHRSFWALSEGIDRGINRGGNQDVVFPASYFSGQERKEISYAIHHHSATWITSPSSFEMKMKKKFRKIIKKDDEAILVTLILAGISFLGCIFLFIYAHRLNEDK